MDIDQYVNNIIDKQKYFSENMYDDYVITHKFYPRKGMDKINFGMTGDSITSKVQRPVSRKYLHGKPYVDKFNDFKIHYNLITKKIYYISINLEESININNHSFPNDAKLLINKFNLIKVAIGAYANPELGIMFKKSKLNPSRFSTMYIGNDYLFIKTLDVATTNYTRKLLTMAELLVLIKVLNEDCERIYKKEMVYNYDKKNNPDKWIAENYMKLLQHTEMMVGTYID